MELSQYVQQNLIKKRKSELLSLCGELGIVFKSRWTKGVLAEGVSDLVSDPEELSYILPRSAFLALSGRIEETEDISIILDHFGLSGNTSENFPELLNRSSLKLIKRLDILEALVIGHVSVCGLIPCVEIFKLLRGSLKAARGKEWRNLYSDDARLETETGKLLSRRYGPNRVTLKDTGDVICGVDVTEPLKTAYAQEISGVPDYKTFAADDLLGDESNTYGNEAERLQEILELMAAYSGVDELKAMKEELYRARDKIVAGSGELDVVRSLAELAAFPGSSELVAFIDATTAWCGSIRRWELKGYTRDEIEERDH